MEFFAELWSEIRTVGLTALLNPTFLFLLVILFFAGRLVGWLIKSVNLWRILAFAYLAVFLYRPLMDAGLVIGGVFILGAVSVQMDRFRQIFGNGFHMGGGFFRWFSDIWERSFTRRNKSLHEENQRLKEELRRERRGKKQSQSKNSATQEKWRRQARKRNQSKARTGKKGSEDTSKKDGWKQKPRKQRQRRTQNEESFQTGKWQKWQKEYFDFRRQKDRERSEEFARYKREQEKQQKQSKPQDEAKQRSHSQEKQRQKSTSQSQGGNEKQANSQSAGSWQMFQAAKNVLLKELGLAADKDYSPAELKSAWRKRMHEVHPDKNPSDPKANEKFQAVNKAYKQLTG